MKSLFSDTALARRLETCEAMSNVDFVETRARVFPESGAGWMQAAGAYAMYDGATSPLTQTFCLGLSEVPEPQDLDRLEAFFEGRAAPVFHEVSPLADSRLLVLLHQRGYRPFEFTNVMCRPLDSGEGTRATPAADVTVHLVGPVEVDLWARTAARGWSELPELSGMMFDLAKVSAMRRQAASFLAELDGEPVATGALSLHDGVALLAGASTVPEGRRRGAQLALLDARLRHAVQQGCDVATMGALPGSDSQRNAERQGFRVAYTRIKWVLTRGQATTTGAKT